MFNFPYILSRFTFLDKNRLGKIGGGFAPYVRDFNKSKIILSSGNQLENSPEYLIILKHESVLVLLVVVYYRSKVAHPITSFQILSDISPKYTNVIITLLKNLSKIIISLLHIR